MRAACFLLSERENEPYFEHSCGQHGCLFVVHNLCCVLHSQQVSHLQLMEAQGGEVFRERAGELERGLCARGCTKHSLQITHPW